MRSAWRHATLGQVTGLIKRGRAPVYAEGGLLVLSQKCVRGGQVATELARRTDSCKRPVPDWAHLNIGDTLVNSTGRGTLGRVGFVNCLPEAATVDTHVTIVRPLTDLVVPEFLTHVLHSRESELVGMQSGSTNQTELSPSALEQLTVSLPPLQEQRRIVDLIGSIDCATSAALRLQATFARVLTALATDCWVSASSSVPLGDLGSIVTGSTPPTADRDNWAPPTVPFFTPSDFGGRLVIVAAARRVSRQGASLGRPVPAGSVAMVCIGATLGKVGTLGVPGLTNQQINALVGLDAEDALCLAALLSCPLAQTLAWASSGRTTLPILNKSAWSRLPVRWPERAVRETYSGLFCACEAALQAVTAEISALGRLRRSALDELLSGDRVISPSYDRFLKLAS